MKPKKPIVVVTGDPTVDWGVILPDQHSPTIEERLSSRATSHWHWGGAFALGSLIHLGAQQLADIRRLEPEAKPPAADDTRMHHSYNTIQRLPLKSKKSKEGNERLRVSRFLGFHAQGDELTLYPQPRIKRRESPELVVIDDAGFGFGKSSKFWPPGVLGQGIDGLPFLLLKLGTECLTGSVLWEEISRQISDLCGNFGAGGRCPVGIADRIIAVTTAESLRAAGATVSRGLSWERSAQDVLAELNRALDRNSALSGLAKCKRLVISFGPSGVLLVDRSTTQPHYTIYFDRTFTEGTWGREHANGHMFGYGQALTAAIARSLLKKRARSRGLLSSPADNSEELSAALSEGIRSGLVMMQEVYNQGFDCPEGSGGELILAPTCMDTSNGPLKIGESVIREPEFGWATWSILEEVTPANSLKYLARSVAREGPDELKNVPIGEFNDLTIVDRRELEGLRTVQNSLVEYLDDHDKKTPRSIAVFGAPGDGKSFAVRQVVKSIDPDREEELEFNLSQFNSVGDLTSAFHQVRDRSLQGRDPLVFWDEFDTALGNQPLGWLRHFLAPMQDGVFRQGEIVHPIGRAIFVFAGGTSTRYSEFLEKVEENKSAKVTDFTSRLSGYLDVIGPNPRDDLYGGKPYWIVHRALLLNHFLKAAGVRENGGGLDIDEGVLRAFLEIGNYRHGARSMAAIIDISRLHKGGRFGPSSLPPQAQLNLHVNSGDFLKIVRETPS